MIRHFRNASLVALILLGLLKAPSFGQSLSIYRDSVNQTSIEATSPLEIGYRVQASLDLKTWEDITDQAAGLFSFRLDTSAEANRFFRLRTWTTADAPITVVLLGDSAVADFAVNNNQFAGWGQGIYGYLKPNVRAVNLALAMQSTKVFLASVQKDYLLKIKPDFVLIHFGGVDAANWPDPYFTSLTDYEANLKTIVRMVRDFAGTPILMTPANPRYFDETGKAIPFIQDRMQVVRNVAAETQTYLIDLNQLTLDLYNELGEGKSAHITWADSDRSHYSLSGAEVIAGLVVQAFPSILQPHVVRP